MCGCDAAQLQHESQTLTRIFVFVWTLGAGVTPAEGSLKPTVGFISIRLGDPGAALS
jgi:hypothetical protein